MREVRYKKTWKGSGSQSDYFQKPPFIKPMILDEWTMQRMQMPERAYTKFFFSKIDWYIDCILLLVDQKPFNYTTAHTREFGVADENTLSERYKEMLQEQKKQFIDYVERPSKYVPEPKEPLCLARETKYFKTDAQNKEFGSSTHTTWERFQKTIRSPSYQ